MQFALLSKFLQNNGSERSGEQIAAKAAILRDLGSELLATNNGSERSEKRIACKNIGSERSRVQIACKSSSTCSYSKLQTFPKHGVRDTCVIPLGSCVIPLSSGWLWRDPFSSFHRPRNHKFPAVIQESRQIYQTCIDEFM